MRDGISGISPTHRRAINIKRCPNTNKKRGRAPLNLDFNTALNPERPSATAGDHEGKNRRPRELAREEIPTSGSGRAINSQWMSAAVRRAPSIRPLPEAQAPSGS